MANLKNVIYLSNEDYELLLTNGSVTINGTTLTYDENDLYITPDVLASQSENGLMSAEDKIKLDSIIPDELATKDYVDNAILPAIPPKADGQYNYTIQELMETLYGGPVPSFSSATVQGISDKEIITIKDSYYGNHNYVVTMLGFAGDSVGFLAQYIGSEGDKPLGSITGHFLQDLPTKDDIPLKTSDLTNDSGFITGVSWGQVTDKPTFATVAGTGDYNDLINKPQNLITGPQVEALLKDKADKEHNHDAIYAPTSHGHILATSANNGFMSATDKANLDTIVESFNSDDADTTIDTIKEVLKAFENAPEGTNIVNALANKVDKVSGKGLSTNDLTAALKTNYDAAYTHSTSTHARTDATKVEASSTNGKIKINGTEATVYTHPGSGTNPHGTTKSDIGLGNVGNFKAVSTVASQDLTTTEKSNARANIGAGTSNFSGSYNDLTNKPTLLTLDDIGADNLYMAHGDSTSPTVESRISALSFGKQDKITTDNKLPATNISGLATVATSGSYNDLSNKPTIPTVPTSLKNPNSLIIKAGSDTVSSYDGSAAKTFTIAASTTNGAFTISDGTTTKTIQLAGKFTDTTYSSKTAASGGTATSLVTTGEKYTWNNKQDKITSSTDLTLDGLTATTLTLPNFGEDQGNITVTGLKADAWGDAISETVLPTAQAVTSYVTTKLNSLSYNNLTDKPTIPEAATTVEVGNNGYVTSSLLANQLYANRGHNHNDTYQAKDADLTAIAALTGTSGLLKKTAANTWALDTNTYLTSVPNLAASKITSGTFDAARIPAATSSAIGGVKTSTGITNSSGTISVTYGTSAGTACQGNDSRLSDARTPTAHNQASNTINAMTGYSKPSSTSAIAASDTLNAAIGKLEKALDGKGTSSLTIGSTSTTAAAGNHTHPASLATYTGTSAITLSHGSKYKLTTGGSSIIFRMPSDTNTWRPLGTGAEDACAGNDSRLSDSRNPKPHTHGNIANGGTLGTASMVVVTDSSKKITTSSTISTTELGYLDGVTSNIQDQLNAKQDKLTFTYNSTTKELTIE